MTVPSVKSIIVPALMVLASGVQVPVDAVSKRRDSRSSTMAGIKVTDRMSFYDTKIPEKLQQEFLNALDVKVRKRTSFG